MMDKLKMSIVFRPFIERYHHVLEYEKAEFSKPSLEIGKTIKIEHARYMWLDADYKDYMRKVLSIMEPILYHPREILIDEMDDFLLVIFFIKGQYKIGFSLNNKPIYVK